MATKKELKNKFATGMKPTGENFADLIEHQGVQGEVGPKGTDGKDGEDGKDGTVTKTNPDVEG